MANKLLKTNYGHSKSRGDIDKRSHQGDHSNKKTTNDSAKIKALHSSINEGRNNDGTTYQAGLPFISQTIAKYETVEKTNSSSSGDTRLLNNGRQKYQDQNQFPSNVLHNEKHTHKDHEHKESPSSVKGSTGKGNLYLQIASLSLTHIRM